MIDEGGVKRKLLNRWNTILYLVDIDFACHNRKKEYDQLPA